MLLMLLELPAVGHKAARVILLTTLSQCVGLVEDENRQEAIPTDGPVLILALQHRLAGEGSPDRHQALG
jgi:hypothetical protein